MIFFLSLSLPLPNALYDRYTFEFFRAFQQFLFPSQIPSRNQLLLQFYVRTSCWVNDSHARHADYICLLFRGRVVYYIRLVDGACPARAPTFSIRFRSQRNYDKNSSLTVIELFLPYVCGT